MVRLYSGEDLLKVITYYGLNPQYETTQQFKIVCPFHGDVNPSMLINLSEGEFYCFGCGAKGNAWDFVSLVHPELSDLQVCLALEKIIRTNEVKALKVRKKVQRKSEKKRCLIEAKDYYYGLRSVDWKNPQNEEEQDALEYMMSRGFDADALNVAQCKATYDSIYPVVFPILDNGKFKGYVCRTNNKRVEQFRKYLYNEGFDKRNTLCGQYKENRVVILCEGYMDYLNLRTKGNVKNVCAVLGWHISDGQVQELKEKGIKTVVSALDNDKSGIKGTEYLRNFFNVIRFPFPKGIKDPGEMSGKELRKAVRRAKHEYYNNS